MRVDSQVDVMAGERTSMLAGRQSVAGRRDSASDGPASGGRTSGGRAWGGWALGGRLDGI